MSNVSSSVGSFWFAPSLKDTAPLQWYHSKQNPRPSLAIPKESWRGKGLKPDRRRERLSLEKAFSSRRAEGKLEPDGSPIHFIFSRRGKRPEQPLVVGESEFLPRILPLLYLGHGTPLHWDATEKGRHHSPVEAQMLTMECFVVLGGNKYHLPGSL